MMKLFRHLSLVTFLTIFFSCDNNTNHQEINSEKNSSNINASRQDIEFSEEGNIKSRTVYSNNKKIAKWTSNESFDLEDISFNYYSDGILKSKGYKDIEGNSHGRWLYYDRHGELDSDRYYFHGEPDGHWYSYIHGEKKVVKHDYIKGDGVWEEFYHGKNKAGLKKDTSFVIETTSFKNHILNGLYIAKNSSGNIKLSGNYENGKKNGEWKYYESDKKTGKTTIYKVENYSNGLLDGEFKQYFTRGENIKIIGQYQNGKKIGDWFWYFDENKESSYRKDFSS